MSGKTKIAWTDQTWNPVTGCTAVSPGCKNCYAAGQAKRFWHKQYPAVPTGEVIQCVDETIAVTRPRQFSDVQCHPERLDIPLHWRKPRMIFVNSMSDTFHEKVPRDFQRQIFKTIIDCPQHTFQVLTKRPENIRKVYDWGQHNLWLGVTAEDQKRADERIPILLDIPAAVRFVSLEPLLEDIKLKPSWLKKLSWVIVGCESGPKRRPCNIARIERVVDDCKLYGVPCFVKQISINGRVSKNPDDWPKPIRVRQWPGR